MTLSFSLRTIRRIQTTNCVKSLNSFHFPYQIHPSSDYHTIGESRIHRRGVESGTLLDAQHVLDKSPQRDPLECNGFLFQFSRNNQNQEALNLFAGVFSAGCDVDGLTLSCVLKVCGCVFDHILGKQIHCYCVKRGFLDDVSVGTSLVDLYMKTENVDEGRNVFYDMGVRNVVSWTSLMAGFVRNGLNDQAVELFCQMQVEGINPNPFTFATVLGALADEGMVGHGMQVHTVVIKNGFESTTFVSNSLINLYAKTRMAKNARNVFDLMENRDVSSWSGMLAGYVTNGLHSEAFDMFYQMRLAGLQLTNMVFVTIIKLCAKLRELCFARQLHCQILKNGYGHDQNMGTALMVAYNRCSEMDDAYKMFSTMDGVHNVVSWTAIISGYLQNDKKEQASNLFCQMSREGIRPNHFTYSTILTAQPVMSPLIVHTQVIKTNYEKSPSVGTALLDAYFKTGNVIEAAKVFELIEEKDIVAWSAMLAGYAQTGDTEGAAKIFSELTKEGLKPNEFTFSSVINACASQTAAVEQGKQFHASSIKSGFSNGFCVSSALVTMYAKRGNIESANEVFRRQRERDLISWNSMVTGYAQHGHGKKALEIFEDMRKQNLAMDGVTFIGVISACTHTGLVDEGQRYFTMMVNDHHIDPTMEHYSCMVDLYGRAGMIEKAMDIINRMPFPPVATVWRTLLAACRVHLNVELGKLAAEKLISLQPQDSAAYVLLSNIYAASGNWKERAKVRKLMEERKVKKEAGYSWIEVKNKTHSFLAGDLTHPSSKHIYLKLEELSIRLKDAGYQPNTSYVLHDVEEEHKETILSQHSERLAIAFGLISTPWGTPIQIVKNLRVCGDCHTVIKLISMIEERDIVVRDSNRFHHFKGGLCSCADYW